MAQQIVHQGERAAELCEWVAQRISTTFAARFSYVGVRRHGRIRILKAAFIMNSDSGAPPVHFGTGELVAGSIVLEGGLAEIGHVCSAMVEGTFNVSGERFSLVDPSRIGVDGVTLNLDEGNPGYQQNEPAVSRITGQAHDIKHGSHLDWRLKAADPPYDSLIELTGAYGVGPISETSDVDVVALQIARIEGDSSIHDLRATIALLLYRGMDAALSKIGYRVISQSGVVRRGVIRGEELAWSDQDRLIRGEATMDLEPGEIVHTYAVYGDRAQHQYWIVDPAHTQNPRRSAYEAADEGLAMLRVWLRGEGKKKADDFEFAVSTLAWLLGFATLHYERKKVSASPDILLACDSGLIVAECTTETFTPEKTAKLVKRGVEIGQRLGASGHGSLPVRCVIASSASEAALKAQYGDLGDVILLPRESLLRLLDRTVQFPNANALFAEVLTAPPGDAGEGVA